MNEPRVVWGEDGFASVSGWTFAHCINQSTGELLYSQDVWVVVGTGLPAGAFLDTPPQTEDGEAAIRRGDEWVLVDDLRGITAYDKLTRLPTTISILGDLPSNLTTTAPTSQFDVWNEERDEWVRDDVSEKRHLVSQADSQKAQLTASAEQSIRPLERAKQLGIATDEELAALTEWERYSVFLMRVDTSNAPDIDWPVVPTV